MDSMIFFPLLLCEETNKLRKEIAIRGFKTFKRSHVKQKLHCL